MFAKPDPPPVWRIDWRMRQSELKPWSRWRHEEKEIFLYYEKAVAKARTFLLKGATHGLIQVRLTRLSEHYEGFLEA